MATTEPRHGSARREYADPHPENIEEAARTQIANRDHRDELRKTRAALETAIEAHLQAADATHAAFVAMSTSSMKFDLAAGTRPQLPAILANDIDWRASTLPAEFDDLTQAQTRLVFALSPFDDDHRGLASWRECALEDETLDEAIFRVRAQHINVSGYAHGIAAGAETDNASSTNERQDADRKIRYPHLARLEAELVAARETLARHQTEPAHSMFGDSFKRMGIERQTKLIEWLEAQLANLPKRRAKSIRTRRRG